jgi:hypothetical protein
MGMIANGHVSGDLQSGVSNRAGVAVIVIVTTHRMIARFIILR